MTEGGYNPDFDLDLESYRQATTSLFVDLDAMRQSLPMVQDKLRQERKRVPDERCGVTPVDDRRRHHRREVVRRNLHLPRPETQVGQMRTDRVLVWLTVDSNVKSRHTGESIKNVKGPFPVGPVLMPNCSSSSSSSAIRQQSPGDSSVQSRRFYTSRRLSRYVSSRRTPPDNAARDTPHTADASM